MAVYDKRGFIISGGNAGELWEPMYLGAFRQGETNASGYTESDYRISSADTIGLPMGTERTIKGHIDENYVIGIRTGVQGQNLSNNSEWYTGDFEITIPDADNYYRIHIARSSGGTAHEADTLTPSDMNNMELEVYWARRANVLEDNKEAEKTVSAAKMKFIDYPYSPNTIDELAVITHTSDPHGDYQRVKSFYEFSEKIRADMACVTGDLVAYYPWNGLGWFKDLTNGCGVLPGVCVGNHDVSDDSMDDDDVYDLVYDGIEEKIGNETGKTWYVKDIDAKKLRVISVNLYQDGEQTESGGYRFHTHLLSDQISWLIGALSGTPNGYGVLIMSHAPQKPTKYLNHTGYDTFFQVGHREEDGTHCTIEGGVPLYDIVDAFIGRTTVNKNYTQKGTPPTITVSADFSGVDASVEFIAHLTGHMHMDAVGYVQNTEHKQLMLNVICTCALYGGVINPYIADATDMSRNRDDATQDSFNVYVIDREKKNVRIVRVGANMTWEMKERKHMIIPYADE